MLLLSSLDIPVDNIVFILKIQLNYLSSMHLSLIMKGITVMVGDVNINMNDLDDSQMAEIEIMIPEPRRYHLAFHFSVLVDPFPVFWMCRNFNSVQAS